jgi:molybdate transport system substrate-binding protein
MMRLHAWLARALLLFLAVFAFACGDDAGPDPTPGPPSAARPLSGTLTIFAASSLTDAFAEIFSEFRRINPGVEITPQFAGSPALRTQLEQGARADIFASADLAQMQMALDSGVVRDAGKTFARNSLVIITPRDNPGSISAPVDLKKPGLKLVLAAPEVPIGNYARQSLVLMEKDPAFGAGFAEMALKNVVSNESNVRQVVAKVELGEADAGIVYGTDVTQSVAPKLAVVQIPAQFNVVADYPIALTKSAGNARAAQAFIDYIFSRAGQDILKKYGFLTAS